VVQEFSPPLDDISDTDHDMGKKAMTPPKYLRYRCWVVCGGWSDRWKGAVLTYMLAKRSNRIFRMQWDNMPLTTVFEQNDIFKPVHQECPMVNWFNQKNQSLTLPEADCIDVRANVIPEKFKSEYPTAALELWNKLTLRKELLSYIDKSPGNMRCAQIRNGQTNMFQDIENAYGSRNWDNTSKRLYEKVVFEWLGSEKNTHLWTDFSEQEQRWRSYNPSAFFVDGPIEHIDFNPSVEGLKRTVIQWALIAKCDHIAPYSGYIRNGLFLAPTAKIEHLSQAMASVKVKRHLRWDGCQTYEDADIQKGLFLQLKKIVSVFSRKGIRYALTAGSLIGALRDKDINPYENDNDILVYSSFSMTPDIVQALHEQKLHTFPDGGVTRICNMGSSISTPFHGGGPYRIFTDIYMELPKLIADTPSETTIFNVSSFESVNIRGLNVQIPSLEIAKAYLNKQYSNWKDTKWADYTVNLIRRKMKEECYWTPSDNQKCSELVQNIFKRMKERRILFLGDSTMRQLFNNMQKHKKNIIESKRCTWLQEFGIKKSTGWVSPSKDAGPVEYGLKTNWCTDCGDCNTYFYTGEGRANSFVAVDFAKDVEMQSEIGNTTQETLVNFLKTQHKYELCVVNTGLHDQFIKDLTTQNYVSNVKQYLQLLRSVCLQMIWIETTPPLRDGHGQTKAKTEEWNREVNWMIMTQLTGVHIIKVETASLHWPYKDNVLLNSTWYLELGRLFNQHPELMYANKTVTT
tara:strand:- start:9179 stop:11407 length:2229 start_codon:yes stop_codon:yes gene_type:complete